MNQHDSVAQLADIIHGMRNQEDGLSPPTKILNPLEALPLKSGVAYAENLIDDQNIGIDFNRNGKSEAHVHSGRVLLHRGVNKVSQFRKLDDGLLAFPDLALGQPQKQPVEQNVLAAGQFVMKSGAQLNQRSDGPLNFYPSLAGRVHSGHNF